MSVNNKKPTKEQLLKAIENLETNPNDKLGILADIGVGAVGAAGAGAAAVAFGGGAVPILFGLISLPVAAPLGVVAGAAVLGAGAFVGLKRVFVDGTREDGKREQMLIQLKERVKDIESKQKASTLGEDDKNKFISFLKEPIQLDLISPEDAQQLMVSVNSGQMSLNEAYQLVRDIISSGKIT